MIVSKPTTVAGKNTGRKNATSPEEQAMAEAMAKRKKKLEKEYKVSVTDIDNLVWREPMTAHEFAKVPVSYPAYTQPKLDGVRCVVKADGMYSRYGKVFKSCPHIQAALQPLFDKDPTLEFDGELYNHKLKDNFDELISLIKQQKPTEEDLRKSAEMVEFHIYDLRLPDMCFSDRSVKIAQLLASLKHKERKMLVEVETAYVETAEELDEWYETWLGDGYEGQMIRTDTPYEFKRTNCLLKRKETITEEFEVVDVWEGVGNRSGMAGKVIVKLHKPATDGKETCEANPIGGFAFYKRLLVDKETVIGKMATIRFQNYTPKRSLRFPRCVTIRDYE